MTTPHTTQQRTALSGLRFLATVAAWLLVHGLILAHLLTLTGCAQRSGANILAEQRPGEASGAGATLTGPTNAAAATTQTAKRRVGYYPPPSRQWPLPTTGLVATPAETTLPVNATTPDQSPSGAVSPAPLAAPAPAWIDETVTTTIGQHQDAAGLIKAASAMASWGKARWLGIVCILCGAFGLAWAHNNPDGYPLICWKIAGIGLALAIFDPSPWWLLALLLPAAFYIWQKLQIKLPT